MTKILDVTMRDGGLVNNFNFSDEFVKKLYETNIKSGVTYMEFGYRNLPEEGKGKWRSCSEEDLHSIVGDNKNSILKVAVMVDIDKCDIDSFLPADQSVIDMVRVAAYQHQLVEATKLIEHFKKLGYETVLNLMAISTVSKINTKEIDAADYFYIMDSYGSLFPSEIKQAIGDFPTKQKIGFHAHNNQQLAYANTIAAIEAGADIVDASYLGMGRGAGNCPMELLLNNTGKNNVHVYEFIQNYVQPMKNEFFWGYHPAYAITGQKNQHPRAAIEVIKNNLNICEII